MKKATTNYTIPNAPSVDIQHLLDELPGGEGYFKDVLPFAAGGRISELMGPYPVFNGDRTAVDWHSKRSEVFAMDSICEFRPALREFVVYARKYLQEWLGPVWNKRTRAFLDWEQMETSYIKRQQEKRIDEFSDLFQKFENQSSRILKYLAAMFIHDGKPWSSPAQWGLIEYRAMYFIDLLYRKHSKTCGAEVDDLIHRALLQMGVFTKGALRGYLDGASVTGPDGLPMLDPEVAHLATVQQMADLNALCNNLEVAGRAVERTAS